MSLPKSIPIFSRDGSLTAGIIAGALFGLEFIVIYAGLDLTSASRGTLMTSTMPFFLMIGAHYLLGEHITPAEDHRLGNRFCRRCRRLPRQT